MIRGITTVTLTFIGSIAFFNASRFENRCFPIVVQSTYKSIFIAVPAILPLAVMPGITRLGAGRVDDLFRHLVPEGIDISIFETVAAVFSLTFMQSISFLRAGRGNDRFDIAVAQCLRISIFFRIATVFTFAGMYRISLFRTGRLHDLIGIIVPQSGNIAFFACAACRTNMLFFPFFGTGCGVNHLPFAVIMGKFIYGRSISVSAVQAKTLFFTFRRTCRI